MYTGLQVTWRTLSGASVQRQGEPLGSRRGMPGPARRFAIAAEAIALGLIRIYQLALSPLLGPRCRFEPSCSRYAATCIERFGLWRGALLGARRLGRCHPFHPGGYDPPPMPGEDPSISSTQS